MHRIIPCLLALLLLAGCAGRVAFNQNAAVPAGPTPVTLAVGPDALKCVSAQLNAKDREVTFTVAEFTDKTGKTNTGGGPDATGAFNSQAGEMMLYTALGSTGVKTVVMTPATRALTDWMIAKQGGGKLRMPDVLLSGSISTTDFDGGDGAGVSVGGVGLSDFQNRAFNSLDLFAALAPTGDQAGGELVARVVIAKQIVQDGKEITVSRFVGNSLVSTYVAGNIGKNDREPLQFSARAMINLALAEIYAQKFHKGGSCLPHPVGPSMVASAR